MRTERVLRVGVVAGLMAAGLGSAGCSTMNNTEKGALTGGALGTGVGLLAGSATGNPRTGAVVGGLLGAGAGGLIGNAADKEEKRERELQQASALATAQAQRQRMGVFDVIRMARGGHDDQVIINEIHNTGSTFQLTATDLDALKDNGVSPRVITAMQTTRAAPAPTRVVVREPAPTTTTVIYEQPAYPAPVIVRPVYVAPPPPRPIFVGGYYHHHRR